MFPFPLTPPEDILRSTHQIVLALSSFAFFNCATTYKAPTTVAPLTSVTVTASKADLMRSAKQVLVTEGFQITNSDEAGGIISTAPTNLKVTPEQADCGTTMGIDYLKDKRTATRVGYGVIADEGKLTVKATIEGEYKPGDVTQNITLTCVSRGMLEKAMADKITAGASH